MLTQPRMTRNFGAELLKDGVVFRFWAPNQPFVSLMCDGVVHRMRHTENGWYELRCPGIKAGALYRFVLADGLEVPDPASRYQPRDVHGPSQVVDPAAYAWRDSQWTGRPWEECVLYELHIGTFTPEGSFAAAIGKLDWLVETGITAIEIMPVADFPGRRNWGYDGALLFAPDASYGHPDDFKALVDAAHARGLMVLLDVVYNHFGPDGNYLPTYAPIFTERHQTPWGAAVNYDADGSDVVREFIIENAGYWIDEFHLDGLRLDAVHAIKDDSDTNILEIIAQRARWAAPSRPVHLLLENEENQASLIARNSQGAPIHYTAQWNDDIHHVLHAAATGETSGYYAAYAGDTHRLGRALAEGFAFQGEHMDYRDSRRGEPSSQLPPTAFVAFIQNHDQIGNRAFGDRLTSIAPPEAVRAVTAIYLLLPQVPMIFMGEEFGASTPFPFFCDFAPELAKAVREGRRAEFAKFPEFADPHQRELIPDPTLESTFQSAKLDWSEASAGDHAQWVCLYRELLAIRHREIVPRLKAIRGHAGSYRVLDDGLVSVQWLADGARLNLVANLSDRLRRLTEPRRGRTLWSRNAGASCIEAWGVAWSIEES